MNLDTASKSYVLGTYDLCQLEYFVVEEIPDAWQKQEQSDVVISVGGGLRMTCRLYATAIKQLLGVYKATGINKFTATRKTEGKGVTFAGKK